MDEKKIKKLLHQYHLKLTTPRHRILDVFFSSDHAITYSEILKKVEKDVDRVTIYRTLKSFEDIGVIHRVIGAIDTPVYALSLMENQLPATENSQYLHFSCVKCRRVFCMNEVAMPGVALPEQYVVHSLSLTVVGVCEDCNDNLYQKNRQPD